MSVSPCVESVGSGGEGGAAGGGGGGGSGGGGGGIGGKREPRVGRRRLTVSNPVLRAPMVSALETIPS